MMGEKKKYVLKTNLCDSRNMSESLFDHYDSVTIESNMLLVSQESKALLNKYGADLNVNLTLEVQNDADVSIQNGKFSIKPGAQLIRDRVLVVNGVLDIEAGSEEILKRYVQICVNGVVQYPQCMAPYLGMLTVNGKEIVYPDDCALLSATTVVDKYFHMRARQNGHYFANKKIVMLDPEIAADSLVDKKVHFTTPKLVVSESLLPQVIGMFDENIELIVVADGCGYVRDDVVMDDFLIRKYGKKIFANGNLVINEQSANALGQVEYLYVAGRVEVSEQLADAFSLVNARYSGIDIIRGRIVKDLPEFLVETSVLEAAASGLLVRNCADVKIAEDVPVEMIQERLKLKDCVEVSCSKKQRGAVSLVCENVVEICVDGEPGTDADMQDTDIHLIQANSFVL